MDAKFHRGAELQNVTLVCQDWGGLIGLRVLAQMPERFARLVAMNTGHPRRSRGGDGFLQWRRYSQRSAATRVPAALYAKR